MWAEARKQEKKIRGIMVDHKKRAERRREYYEKIKQDPAQFLQISGRSYKLHIDHNAAGPEPPNTIMPWQGNSEILIDRFDVRAHLDYIAEAQIEETYPEESKEMRPLNYERYWILVQNGFLKIKEEKFLKTIALEEKYGGKTYQQQKAEDDKKKVEKSKAAIGFTYEDSTSTEASQQPIAPPATNPDPVQSESDDDFDDLDTVINISALSKEQQYDLNSIGRSYFLGREDFIKYLQHEAEEQENAKNAKAEEDEKSAFSGRKSRKERRILKEKRLAGRIPSPPSYATYDQGDKKSKNSIDHSTSDESSRSASPVGTGTAGKVEYITTFGEENTKRNSKDKKSKKRIKRDRSSSSSSSSDDGRSGGKYRSKYRRKRRSSSSSSEAESQTGNGTKVVEPPPPPPVKRYYGRKREDSDEEKLTEDEESATGLSKSEFSNYHQFYTREASNDSSERGVISASISGSGHHRSSVVTSSSRPGSVQNLKDKLKKRMQSQLQKHYKADKRAEIDRKIRAEEARMNREEELKEMMRKVKAKRDSGDNTSSDSDSAGADKKSGSRHRRARHRSRSCSSSRSSSADRRQRRRRRSRSRSRSRSHRR